MPTPNEQALKILDGCTRYSHCDEAYVAPTFAVREVERLIGEREDALVELKALRERVRSSVPREEVAHFFTDREWMHMVRRLNSLLETP